MTKVWIVHKRDIIYGVFTDHTKAMSCKSRAEYELEMSGYTMLNARVIVTGKVMG